MFKKIIISSAFVLGLASLGFAVSANAAVPGFYVGGQAGWADTGYNNHDWNASSVDNDGFAYGGFAGYQFNQYLAGELGYTQFPNTHFNGVGHVDEYGLDAVAKGIIPLSNGFSIFGKAGAVYLNAQGHGNLSGTDTNVYPTFGGGISYDVTPNLPIAISYMRDQKVSDGSDAIPSTNLVGISLAYHFG